MIQAIVGLSPALRVSLGALPFVFVAAVALICLGKGADRPRAIIGGLLAFALLSDTTSEVLGFFRMIGFLPFLGVWLVAVAAAGCLLYQVRHRVPHIWQMPEPLPILIVTVFAGVTLFIALTAAPNNWDSLTYHLPKVEHWIQDHSLAFYPTADIRQAEFPPLAELMLLQSRVLGGSNAYYLLIQWLSMATSVAAVFRITAQLGGNRTQCWIASVFLVSLPIGILESTSTQNDYVEAAFLCAFVTLGIEAIDRPRASLGHFMLTASAGALSGLTKPIAFILGAGFALWFAIGFSRGAGAAGALRRWACIGAVAILVLGPFVLRFSTGAHIADINSQETVASFGVKQTLDNLIRHVVSNLAVGIEPIDRIPIRISESITYRLGLQTHRADTTDPLHPVYLPAPGLYIYHEDFGPNQLATILVTLALIGVVIRWPTRPTRRQLAYCGAWAVGVLIFATLLRFGMWVVRYHLPGFALAAPIVALRWPPQWERGARPAAFMLLTALTSVPALMFNQGRQLVPLYRTQFPALGRDRPSYLSQTPWERLFANQLWMMQPYRDAIDVLERSNATQIGLAIDKYRAWEYPIWWALQQEVGSRPLRIEHVLVPGETKYPLGPFVPEVLFWDEGQGEAPETLSIGGQQFRRIFQTGPLIAHPNRLAVFARQPG